MHTWQDARSLNLFKHLCTTEPSIVPMPPISYIRWSLSLDMLVAIPAGTRSVYPSGLACPGVALVGQKRASVHRGEVQGTMLQVEPRGEDRFKRDAAMARAARGRIECSGSDRPTVLATLHYTSLHARRGGIQFQMSSSRRHDQTSSHLQVTKAVAGRGGPVRSTIRQVPGGVPVPSLNHQHRQCRGKMRAQIESEAYVLGVQGGEEEAGIFASIEETECTP